MTDWLNVQILKGAGCINRAIGFGEVYNLMKGKKNKKEEDREKSP